MRKTIPEGRKVTKKIMGKWGTVGDLGARGKQGSPLQ